VDPGGLLRIADKVIRKLAVIAFGSKLHSCQRYNSEGQDARPSFGTSVAADLTAAFALIEHTEHTNVKPKNTICLWFDKDAHEAARFYAATFPDSEVTAVHSASVTIRAARSAMR
jgi:hypothetical protein